MTTIKLNSLAFSIFIGLTIAQTVPAQITIGSTTAPAKGALLELKNGEDISTKGLGLPRVSLKSNSSLEPCLSSTMSNNQTERDKHIGLVVYNVFEIDGTSDALMKKEDMLCKGLHVWTGEKWQPIAPYFDPDITRSAPKEKLTITRGPGGVEVTEYTTAYFHGYSRVTSDGTPTTGSVYVCDRSLLKEIDAGQWMTMNLRTKYSAANIELAPRVENGQGQDDQIIARFGEPRYPAAGSPSYPIPLTDEERELNGYLYNWVAATNRKDPKKDLDSEFEIEHEKVQGICPENWHLPSIHEWTDLLYILRAQSHLFGTEGIGKASNLISPFSGGTSLSPKEGSMDFRMLGAVHNTDDSFVNNIKGDPYMKSAYYWSSTAGDTERLPIHNNDWEKWNSRGFNVRLTKSSTIIPSSTAYRSRVLTESVRCKKD